MTSIQISQSNTTELIRALLDKDITALAIKKLAKNDRSWAHSHLKRDDGYKKSNQGGPYIPHDLRQKNFFPELKAREDKPHIFEAKVITYWLRTGERKESRLVNYSNKGRECHLTGVPKEEFAAGPASFLLIGKLGISNEMAYLCLVVDSAEEDACAYLEEMFDIGPEFECALHEQLKNKAQQDADNALDFIMEHIKSGTLKKWVDCYKFPATTDLASEAQKIFMRENGLHSLNPFTLEAPGNALMQISRKIELQIYKEHHRRYYSAKLISILARDNQNPSVADLVKTLFSRFDEIYKEVMLSPVQRMKSRAGTSFEHHVRRVLQDGKIPFDEQKFTGNQRPDFILPSLKLLQDPTRERDAALILSLKTTLRERWKQVVKESRNSDIFLATVDDKVAAETITDMRLDNIFLVVPESLKDSSYAEYADSSNVLTFKEFFVESLAAKRKPLWNAMGLDYTFG